MNPECSDCGEILAIEDPMEMIYVWSQGSPETHRLFAIAAMKIRRIWSCWGCGHFELAGFPPDFTRTQGRRRA